MRIGIYNLDKIYKNLENCPHTYYHKRPPSLIVLNFIIPQTIHNGPNPVDLSYYNEKIPCNDSYMFDFHVIIWFVSGYFSILAKYLIKLPSIMFAYLRGKVAELEPTHVIVDCSGVGYMVKISLQTYSLLRNQDQVKLHTYFQVREDAQILYGFAEKNELTLFEQLIAINGVGGNTALMILSSLSAEELIYAIQQGDESTLKKIKGIGAKTAGRIVLELRDKLKTDISTQNLPVQSGHPSVKKEEALAALQTLGFPRQAMAKRVDSILKEQEDSISVEEIIKIALRNA